ncbi:hypothetical protein C4K88_03675 [Arthrobacter pityocampae]|uniref:Uncharacterized protein n=1 Tax=Arthrobacter pityocampae TaxID=547334 RepID=A0A2S5J2F0_9MICC|nr:hypothetical protein [Arthrobacter pityocampae]PPB50967.1 hypothetical protein C4K88_03675 [Arthrobacter pityocampae]
MSFVLLFTVFPLGLFLTWASLSMIRQKWMYLMVVDGFMPGRPSLAMLPIGILMLSSPFTGLLTGVPQPWSGLVGLFIMACLVFGLLGCFYVPRFLQPRWMKELEDKINRGEGLYDMKYGSRASGQGPVGKPLHPEERKTP